MSLSGSSEPDGESLDTKMTSFTFFWPVRRAMTLNSQEGGGLEWTGAAAFCLLSDLLLEGGSVNAFFDIFPLTFIVAILCFWREAPRRSVLLFTKDGVQQREPNLLQEIHPPVLGTQK
jgi:hypothetical protein